MLLDDPDGDGVALRINSRVIFDGKGSLFRVGQNLVGLDLGPAMDWGSVKDLSIEPERPNEINDTIGIDVNAHGVRLDNLYFNRLGTGIRAHSSSQPPVTNLNVQQWSRLVFIRNFRYAIDLDGRDVNAGLLTGIEVKGGNGILDSSFLGNTYLAPMINGTAVDSITLDSRAGISLVLGAYLEWVAPDMTSRSLNDVHVGGTGIDRVRGPGDRIGVRSAYLNFRHPDNNMRVVIPGSTNAAFRMKHPQENAWWALRYFQSLSTLKWAFTVGDESKSVYRWTSTENYSGPHCR